MRQNAASSHAGPEQHLGTGNTGVRATLGYGLTLTPSLPAGEEVLKAARPRSCTMCRECVREEKHQKMVGS